MCVLQFTYYMLLWEDGTMDIRNIFTTVKEGGQETLMGTNREKVKGVDQHPSSTEKHIFQLADLE